MQHVAVINDFLTVNFEIQANKHKHSHGIMHDELVVLIMAILAKKVVEILLHLLHQHRVVN